MSFSSFRLCQHFKNHYLIKTFHDYRILFLVIFFIKVHIASAKNLFPAFSLWAMLQTPYLEQDSESVHLGWPRNLHCN